VPNADWDNAPTNFFNDFATCGGSGGSDCYRWESFASPLYAGGTSETRTVGFNLDKAAQNVSAYIVVAADLRDNPQQTATIAPEAANCGDIDHFGPDLLLTVDAAQIPVTARDGDYSRGFCSFSLGSLPSDADVVSATLKITQYFISGPEPLGPVVIDHMDYGTLDESDFDLAALTTGIGTFPLSGNAVLRTLDVASQVAADRQAGRTRSQFRFRLTTESAGRDGGGATYFGPEGAAPPALQIVYRHR
jgi:hypothetical protein